MEDEADIMVNLMKEWRNEEGARQGYLPIPTV